MGTGAANLDSGALKPSEGPALVARTRAYFTSDPRRSNQTLLGLTWLLVGALQFQSFMCSRGFLERAVLGAGGSWSGCSAEPRASRPGWQPASIGDAGNQRRSGAVQHAVCADPGRARVPGHGDRAEPRLLDRRPGVGGIFAQGATDPNAGATFVLLTVALYWLAPIQLGSADPALRTQATSLRVPEPPTDFDQSPLLRFESLRRL
jgi:hypothetical protein